MTKVRKALADKKVKNAVRNLSIEEAQEVLDRAGREAESKPSPSDRTPGQIINGMKVPYTRHDLDRIYGIVEFTPDDTIPVTVQGIRYQLFAGVTMSAPKIIQKTYEDYKRQLRKGSDALRNLGVSVDAGAGALPPEVYE